MLMFLGLARKSLYLLILKLYSLLTFCEQWYNKSGNSKQLSAIHFNYYRSYQSNDQMKDKYKKCTNVHKFLQLYR